ncbi:MAG: hypothetical protein H7A35_08815 [Planctomycetales bacterium]|nr:MAG: hypothetical protein H7A35_08815 [Planctomycetales bacterium]
MPVHQSLLRLISLTPSLPAFARPALGLAVRLGLVRSAQLEVVLRYLDTADEAVNWWPPVPLIILSVLLLLASIALFIACLVEFIFRPHPLWLAWTEFVLSIACFWSPLFILAAHYAAKVRMLHRFAQEESANLNRLAQSTASNIRQGHASIGAATDAQLQRMQESSREQMERLQQAGGETASRIGEATEAHGRRLRGMFRRPSSPENKEPE